VGFSGVGKVELMNPSVQGARDFLRSLRGRAYRYAYALYLNVKGKGRKPRAMKNRELSASIARAVQLATGSTRGTAPATFRGMQPRLRGPAIELWNLNVDIPGHPAGSTVARETLEAAGLTLPPKRNAPRRRRRAARATSTGPGFGAGVCPLGHALHWPEGADGTEAWCNACRRRYPVARPNLPTWMDTPEEGDDEPGEDDYTITGTRRGGEGVGQGGKFLGEFPSVNAALQFIADRMAAEQFYPNVWTISDHGNALNVSDQVPKPRKGKRNPLPPCSYCGGTGGFVAGPEHSTGCPFYRKPRRAVRTITSAAWRARQRKPKANPEGDRVIVNGIVYLVVAETTDRQGDLLMIRRPNGRKEYLARRIADTTYGAGRAYIIHTMPGVRGRTNPPRVPANATLIYPNGKFDPGTTWRGTHRTGGRYYHKFRSDTSKAMYGLPGGGIAFIPKRGRLWGYR
jgi:hypothetical protein